MLRPTLRCDDALLCEEVVRQPIGHREAFRPALGRAERRPGRNLLVFDSKDFMTNGVLISVVDDSDAVRESLPDLLDQFGWDTQTFGSAEDFLASDAANT